MATFQETWKPGRNILVIAKPHRRGHVTAVRGSGSNATIICALVGWHITAFSPSELIPLI